MSTITNVESTKNQLITNYDVSKLLLGDNETVDGDVSASGADVEIVQGMIMGRIGSTGKLVPCVNTATNGSQFPVGIALETITVTDGTTRTITVVNKGSIAESKLNFAGAETLDALIGPANNQRQYRDYLNDLGLILEGGTELTAVDNQ
jgi:hypothetical protein